MRNFNYPFAAIVGQERIKRALILNAVSPAIGGVLVKGSKGTAKSTTVRALAGILPPIRSVAGCPYQCDPDQSRKLCPVCRKNTEAGIPLVCDVRPMNIVNLPLGVTLDRVVGTFDLESAINFGRREFHPGLLAGAHRGILYIDEVNLLDDHIIDTILNAAATGENVVEREGLSLRHYSDFILIGTMNPEEGDLRPHFADRFGMGVEVSTSADHHERIRIIEQHLRFEKDPRAFLAFFEPQQEEIRRKINAARNLLPSVTINEKLLRRCSELALQAAAAGHRADICMRRTAVAIAAFEGRFEVQESDVEEAAQMVLCHRSRTSSRVPRQTDGKNEKTASETKDSIDLREKDIHAHAHRESIESEGNGGESGDERSLLRLSEGETLFSVGEPFQVEPFRVGKDRIVRNGSGKRTLSRTAVKAGRYVGSRICEKTEDIAFDATIRAAAPYQLQRKRETVAIAVEKSDLRAKRREKKIGNLIVFVVDASGSMGAEKRMTEVKGAILSLLMDAYQKRDKVALIAFRGADAEVLLPPTASVELAHKLLKELPVGGKTPLCHGMSLAYELIRNALRKDSDVYPFMLIISDGKVNVSIGGGKPFNEALKLAEEIRREERIRTLVIDVEKPGFLSLGLAHTFAQALKGRYFKLEDLKAATLFNLLKEELVTDQKKGAFQLTSYRPGGPDGYR